MQRKQVDQSLSGVARRQIPHHHRATLRALRTRSAARRLLLRGRPAPAGRRSQHGRQGLQRGLRQRHERCSLGAERRALENGGAAAPQRQHLAQAEGRAGVGHRCAALAQAALCRLGRAARARLPYAAVCARLGGRGGPGLKLEEVVRTRRHRQTREAEVVLVRLVRQVRPGRATRLGRLPWQAWSLGEVVLGIACELQERIPEDGIRVGAGHPGDHRRHRG
mmetsp:Transcript_105544/g.286509  ORF Transcript_105544/g.286509 Transcript_105544/m.286509 type:complete len:222 (+) Transcript_105544:1-666(+)